MKKADVTIGKTYLVKVSGKLVPVKITSESPYGGWLGRNEKTGREVRIRGAGRLRQEMKPAIAAFGPATLPTNLTTPRMSPRRAVSGWPTCACGGSSSSTPARTRPWKRSTGRTGCARIARGAAR